MPKNVTDLAVTQIRVFPVDVVPVSITTTKSFVDGVRRTLSIGEAEIRPSIDGKSITIFRRGELKKEKTTTVINRIEVDSRRIIVEVEGTSENAKEVYEAFLTALAEAATIKTKDLRTPLLLAEESRCAVTLDFNLEALFSNPFVKFLRESVQKRASSALAQASVRPLLAAAEITYDMINRTLEDNRITMNPKQLSMSPRPGAPPEARRFLVSSPFDSSTHLKLLEELESKIGAAKKRA